MTKHPITRRDFLIFSETDMEIFYRKATAADLDEIEKLVAGAIARMIENGIYQWDELYPTRDDFADDIALDSLYVGETDGEICIVFAINHNHDEEYADGNWTYDGENYLVVHRVCVRTEYQRRGIADKTVDYIEKLIKDAGADSIRLDTFTENPFAIHMYEKHGFAIVGTMRLRKGLFYLFEKNL